MLLLTASKQVNRIITDMAVMDIDFEKGITLKEIAPGVTVDQVERATDSRFIVAEDLKIMEV